MTDTTMKKLTKLAAAAIVGVALFIGTNANAQSSDSRLRFGIGVEVGAPTGNASNGSNIYAGVTPRLQYGADEGLAWTLTSGFYNFFGKNYTVGNTTVKGGDLGMVPVKLGIKGFFAENFYFGAEAGAGFETISNGNTKLIVAPGLGFANDKWDVSARYENFSGQGNNYGLVGLRVAYGFKL
jgi:hypothetical protein